jgi:UDP-N-acetylglucosamine--N-acetylmuramyl-(pentapeptide) pyrophosphoryl-undecaprenol N-acetylglucosamine transferase
VLGRLVRRVFTAFPQAEKFFKKKKVRLLGNPVRKALADSLQQAREDGGKNSLLVFGGSQGARILNQVVPEAVETIRERLPELEVVHQTGERECDEVKQRYRERGMTAEVLPFIHDMAAAYRKADLVVSRAGATTVAELSLCRKPAVLIPFPYAADNHQVINAQALVESGAAVMILQSDLDARRLADEAGAILADGKRRAAMEEAAAKVARPDSAKDICDSCLELAEKSRWRKKEVANAS